jgi:hypothetical protein
VKVWIQIQASAESLDAGDGAGSRGGDAGPANVVGRNDFVENASDGRENVRAKGH